jgi:hypothetical protein
MLNLLLRRGRRCRILRWRILDVRYPPVELPVVFGVFRQLDSERRNIGVCQESAHST